MTTDASNVVPFEPRPKETTPPVVSQRPLLEFSFPNLETLLLEMKISDEHGPIATLLFTLADVSPSSFDIECLARAIAQWGTASITTTRPATPAS